MKRYCTISRIFVICAFALAVMAPTGSAQEIYGISFSKINSIKAFYDDPRPLYNDLGMKHALPPDVYKQFTYDMAAMGNAWSAVVGFKAPEVVGTVAPEIKPGLYTSADRERLPFKELMPGIIYDRFTSAGSPFVGTYSAIKVVPTRHYYWALPISEATRQHKGTSKQDANGYLAYDSYTAGFPFPQPSGPFKAQQIMYNWEKRYTNSDSGYGFLQVKGYSSGGKEDFDSQMEMFTLRLHGRLLDEPFGWFDKAAEVEKESRKTLTRAYSPRDLFGNCFSTLAYLDHSKYDQPLAYINALRKLRKMSGTDVQDSMGGQDSIYDDGDGFNQKLSPTSFTYTYELIAEREYLVPAYTTTGSEYMTEEKKELRNLEFERRPLYVVKLTQRDPNYAYSQRILYFDKETFILLAAENYDQKGRLYRSCCLRYAFHEDMGLFMLADMLARDHIENHSTYEIAYMLPAPQVGREALSLQSMFKSK